MGLRSSSVLNFFRNQVRVAVKRGTQGAEKYDIYLAKPNLT